MLALGRLLRISLLPSALADIVVGVVVGAGGTWPPGAAGLLLVLASLGIYHGAMALNDWADRDEDAQARPERPIPSGAIPANVALGLGLVLVGLGVACAAAIGMRMGIWMSVVAVLAVAYDLRGRGPILGPTLLGLCRFGNLGAGLLLVTWLDGGSPDPALLAPAFLYGLYVFVVSRLGRLEDREDLRPLADRPSRFLITAAVCMGCVPLLGFALEGVEALGVVLSAAVSLGAAWGLVQAARRKEPWNRGAVGACMGLALRRLLAFTAAVALLLVGQGDAAWIAAGIALAGYPASYGLRKVFPPS